MYTTNAVESINSSFRKVTKRCFSKGKHTTQITLSQDNETLQKWNGSKLQNWAMVRNQLAANKKSVSVSKNTST